MLPPLNNLPWILTFLLLVKDSRLSPDFLVTSLVKDEKFLPRHHSLYPTLKIQLSFRDSTAPILFAS